jgi:3'-phosphoadenosine 5'-phosphosulfate (PAPS) 3'-phosphatase
MRVSGEFIECGSIGLKICRVADGSADVFAKELTFKLWDVAPGDLILREAGGRLGLWTGEAIPFNTKQVYFENLLAAPSGLFELVMEELVRGDVPGRAPQAHKKDARC